MVLQSTGTISEGQVYIDSSQNNLIVDSAGNVQNVATYTTGSVNIYPLTGQLNSGIIPPNNEYAIFFSSGTTAGNYISITSAITALNISWATATVYSTVECWIYITSYNTNGSMIFGKCTPAAATLDWQLNVTSTGYLQLIYNTAANGTQTVTSTLAVPLNSWCHVALCFTPATPTNTWFLCLNGAIYSSVLVGTLTTNSSTNLFTIGQYNSTMTHIGYIACVRVLSTSTIAGALYRNAYPIPSYTLTKLSGTALLLRANAKHLVDLSGIITNLYSSSINFNVSYVNTPAITIPDGAFYLNGVVGTYITNTNAAYQFNWWQNGGFTIEFWANFAAFPPGVTGSVQPTLIGNQSATSTTSPWWSFGPNASGQLVFWYVATPSNVFITTTNSIAINTWYHIAFSCDGTNFYVFVNGQLFYTTALVQTPTTITSNLITIGQYNSVNPMNCFISNLRIVKSNCLYTSSFTVSQDPLIPITNCIMLLRATHYALDITKNVNTVSITGSNTMVGGICGTKNTNYNGIPPPGGDGIVYIPNISAGGNYFSANPSAFYFNWWTTKFTCELWVNYQSFTNTSIMNASPVYNVPSLIGMMNATNGTNYWSFGANTDGTISFYYWTGTQQTVTTTDKISLNTWYHIAVTFDLSSIRILINGLVSKSVALTGTPQIGNSGTVNLTIGQANTSYYSNAYISNVRIINGSALYTGTFAVSTVPLNISETGTTVFLLRVPPIECPLSQTSLTKSLVNRYRPNVNVSQGPPPGAIVTVNIDNVNIGYTTNSPPIFDKQTRNGIVFDGISNYLALNTFRFLPFINFTFVATFSYLSSITVGTHLFIMSDANFSNYLSISYTSANTLSFIRAVNGTVYSVTATVYPNVTNSIVYTYNIGGNPPALSIYVNNVLSSTTSISALTVPQITTFTANYIGGLPGSVACSAFTCNNFAIYNRNFAANDVASYYSVLTSIANQQIIPNNPLIDLTLSLSEIIQINTSSVVVTTISSTSFSIYFTGTFTTATLYYYGPDGKSGTSTGVASGSTTTLSSLTINTVYTIVIIPYNSAGISSPYGTYTTTGSTSPNITGFYALVSSLTSVTLYWAGNGFGSNYSYVTVGVSPTVTGAPFTVQSGTPNYLVTGLATFTSYTFTVTPYNANGIAGTAVTYTLTIGLNFTFTTNATGVSGPTSLSYYSTTPLTSLTLTSGIQYWTVPSTGSYTMIAAGASGGAASGQIIGGYGIIVMNPAIYLTQGQVIKILIGQKGGSGATNTGNAGAGGGGTFIVNNTTTTPLLIAGGGGGAGINYYNVANASFGSINGIITTSGGSVGIGTDGGGGSSGNGGVSGYANADGGNGGGGYSGTSTTNQGATLTTSFNSGGTGGTGTTNGGFGSGGGGYKGGGGGGGYSGGGGGGGANIVAAGTPISYLPLYSDSTDRGAIPQTVSTNGSLLYTTIGGYNCVAFDGIMSNYLSFPYTNPTTFTLCYWVYVFDSTYYTMISITNGSLSPALQVDTSSSTNITVFTSMPNQWTISPTAAYGGSGQWAFIAITVNQTTFQEQLYIGSGTTPVATATGTGTGFASRNLFFIGRSGDTGRGFKGYIRQFAVFNTVLTGTQINSYYNSTLTNTILTFSGLNGYYNGGGGGCYDINGTTNLATLMPRYGNLGYNSGDGFAIIALQTLAGTYTTYPGPLTITNIATTTATVSWNIPNPAFTASDTLTLTITPSAGVTLPTINYASTGGNITGLTAGTLYTISLKCVKSGYMDVLLNTSFQTLPNLATASFGTITSTTIPITFTGNVDYIIATWNAGANTSGRQYITPYSTTLSVNTQYTFQVTGYSVSGFNTNTIQVGPKYTFGTVSIGGSPISSVATNSFVVTWNAAGTPATYNTINVIVQQTSNSSTVFTQNAVAGTTTTVNTGLSANVGYTIYLYAVNGEGAANTSATTTTTVTLGTVTLAGTPITGVSSSGFTVNWNSSSTFSTVNIEVRLTSSIGTIVQTINNASGTSYAVNSLASSTGYTVYVYAVNSASVANPSYVSATTTTSAAAPPTSPTYITPFFNGFMFMLQDNASGNYVCYNPDASSHYLCTSGSTLANATIFKVYNNSAVYNNSSGGVALQTYGGVYSDGNYMRHAGYICWSQGFASGNYDFAWLFQTTGTQNVYTLYNWYGGGWYLDISGSYLQITTSARQWKVIAYDYNCMQSCGLFTAAYNLHQWYAYQSISGTTWSDMSGNSRNGSSSATLSSGTDLSNTYTIPYYYGGTGTTVTFGAIPSSYTVFTVTRYNSTTGTTYRRIITGTNENSLQGHWNGYAGVIYHNNWIFPNNNPTTTYVSPNTSWTFTTSTVSGSRVIVQGSTQNSGLTSSSAVGASTGSVTGSPGSFCINASTANVGETSDFAFTEFGAWSRELNVYEMSLINSYVFRKYGIGAAPALHVGSVGYLVFSHKITLNSAVLFGGAGEADNTGSLSLVTSQAQHKYSILNQIGNFRRSDGTYEFLFYICQDDTNFGTMPYRRWTQTSNPYTTGGSATGYTASVQGWNIPDAVGGLRQSGSANTRYDIEASGGNWWGAVGQYNAYNGGLPMDNAARTWIQLWMV